MLKGFTPRSEPRFLGEHSLSKSRSQARPSHLRSHTSRARRGALSVAAALCGVLAGVAPAVATTGPSLPVAAARDTAAPDTLVYHLNPLVVTATRTERTVFLTPAPVSYVSSAALREVQANTVGDVFRDLPGLDVTGVGAQQPRPIIRGQQGQRILLLQDALRLNNSRRQQDFGEIPALVDLSTVARIEVVRGPSSVLYGTDAIGGVVNLITRTPEKDGVHGTLGYRFGSAEELHRGVASIYGRQGALDFQLSGSLRDAGSFTAPAGTFGNVHLAAPTTVFGTGIEDQSLSGRLGFRLHPNHTVFVRGERYAAQDGGFGFVEPAAYDPSQAKIDIRYPDQTFRKLTVGYDGTQLGALFADRASIAAYTQDNVRDLVFNLDQPMGPGRNVVVRQDNHSDVSTLGTRVELKKLALPRLLLTYGGDFFRDNSTNTDLATSTMYGYGPAPVVHADSMPQVPDASFRSVGGFVQGELDLGRTTVVLGSRVQDVRAEAEPIPGIAEGVTTKANRTVVGSASAIHALTDRFSVLAAVGRGFRSPNLIEWFFDGRSTDGRYYQQRNPLLEPETSVNLDVGVRFHNAWASFEGFVYRNKLTNAIRTVPVPDSVIGRLPVYQNVNIDELVFRGLELNGTADLPLHLTARGSYTRQDAQDARDAKIPVGDLYSSKTTAALRYSHPSERFWAEYGVRHNGEQRDNSLVENPIGDVLPAFTVHNLRGGVTLFRNGDHVQRLAVTVGNLTNALYAEAGNVSFFRPEPKRHVVLSWEASF